MKLMLRNGNDFETFFFLNRYPGARRRRRRSSTDERGTMQWGHIDKLTWKRARFTRMREANSCSIESSADNKLLAECSILDKALVDVHLRPSASVTVITDVDGQRISSAVSVKRVTQAEIAKMDNIQQCISKKNPHVNSLDNEKYSTRISGPMVKVVRVKKAPHMDETDESNMNNIPLEDMSTTSKPPDRVPVTRVRRNQSRQGPRHRASSAGSISVIRVNRSLLEVQSGVNRSKTSRTSSAVTVKRVPRRIVTARSNET